MPKLTILTAFYNEEANFPELRRRLTALADQLGPEYSCEFVLVDDHSRDAGPAQAQAWLAEDTRVRYLRLSRNSGTHAALAAGLSHATGDCAVILAADLQDPPELVPQLLGQWKAGNDVVWAVRAARESIPWTTRLTARIYYGMMRRFALANMPAQGADFLLLDRKVIDALVRISEKNTSILGMVLWLGFKQTEVEYTKKARFAGVSKWTLPKKIKLFTDSLLSFSVLPVRIIGYLAGLMSCAAGIMLAVLLGALVAGWPIAAAAWIILTILTVSSAHLLACTILGTYLWRIYDQTRGRPAFVVEKNLGSTIPTSADKRAA